MFNFNQSNSCGCSNGCMSAQPTYQQCNQVVQTANVQDVPHYTNFHTHVVNNCIKRHINIPTYSSSAENVYVDEYVQGTPQFTQPTMYNQPMMYQNQYQGNVGVEPFMQNTYGYQMPYQGFNQAPNPTVNFNM